jgi:hypothetical protein
MGFLGMCEDDPVREALKGVFRNATLVSVPEERIAPLLMVTARKGKFALIGMVSDAVTGDPLAIPPDFIRPSRMPDLSGKKSRSVNVDLGLKIMEGFLRGFGISAPQITAKFEGAREVSFSFGNVVNYYVSNVQLGRLLEGRSIDSNNPALEMFFDEDPPPLLVLNSTVTSSDFTISVEKKRTEDFQLDVPAIQQVVADLNVGVTVSTSSGLDIKFQGDKDLGFAFTAVRFYLDSDGRIVSMPPDWLIQELDHNLDELAGPNVVVTYAPDEVSLGPPDQAALLEWDEDYSAELPTREVITTVSR